MSLAGKVAIVTGSGRGLGLAYAQELARQGAAVIINDVDAATAADAVASIETVGGTASAVVAPVGPTETAKALVAAAYERYGRLDVLVTNAGVLRDTVLWKMSDEDFDLVINVHLRGTFNCVREAATRMREAGEGGRIICIGSPTGQRGNFGQTNYAAAKAGIVGMVRTWALELKKAGITANAVIPVAATAMTATVPYFHAAVEADAKGEPMPEFFRKEIGFGGAAGWFFLKGVTPAKKLTPGQAQTIHLLNLVRANADLKEIEAALKRDVALSVKLLRYINSAGFGLAVEIQSFRHAVTMLGYDKLNKWLSLLLVTSSKDPAAPALMQAAIARGRFMELAGRERVDKRELDNLFIAGAFSLLDILLGVLMETALADMHLPEAINDALISSSGPYAPFLALSRAAEQKDFPRFVRLAGELQLGLPAVNRAQLEALSFADSLQLS